MIYAAAGAYFEFRLRVSAKIEIHAKTLCAELIGDDFSETLGRILHEIQYALHDCAWPNIKIRDKNCSEACYVA